MGYHAATISLTAGGHQDYKLCSSFVCRHTSGGPGQLLVIANCHLKSCTATCSGYWIVMSVPSLCWRTLQWRSRPSEASSSSPMFSLLPTMQPQAPCPRSHGGQQSSTTALCCTACISERDDTAGQRLTNISAHSCKQVDNCALGAWVVYVRLLCVNKNISSNR